jgi:hypothetical protein
LQCCRGGELRYGILACFYCLLAFIAALPGEVSPKEFSRGLYRWGLACTLLACASLCEQHCKHVSCCERGRLKLFMCVCVCVWRFCGGLSRAEPNMDGRLNLHEIWRCPLSHECNKYDCAYDHSSFAQSLSMRRTSTSSSISSSSSSSNRALLIRKPLMRESLDNLHSYVVMDEARITECFKLIDTAGTSAGLDIKEFLTLMMDASLAKDSTDDDYRLNARRRHHIITTGRRWGVAEDWRRHARAKGLFAKRELYASLKTLDHLAAERERAYHCLKEFQRAVADNESELSNREQAEERLKMVGELQASMQAWKKADDGIYWSLNDGCAFLVLAKPLLEYFGLDLPRLNHKCNNVDACVEATLAGITSPNPLPPLRLSPCCRPAHCRVASLTVILPHVLRVCMRACSGERLKR